MPSRLLQDLRLVGMSVIAYTIISPGRSVCSRSEWVVQEARSMQSRSQVSYVPFLRQLAAVQNNRIKEDYLQPALS
jgi:hypothetical protein